MRTAVVKYEVPVPNLNPLLPVFGTIGLILIVLEGALELEINRSKLPFIGKSALLALLPMLLLSERVQIFRWVWDNFAATYLGRSTNVSTQIKERRSARIKIRLLALFALVPSANVKTNLQQALPFWTASLFVGLIAVAYTKLFGYAESWLQRLLAWRDRSIFVLTPGCFVLAWLLVRLLAPAARGSGIPQVLAAIDTTVPKHESKISRLLSLRIAAAKILSSVLMVLGGGAIGREGPAIQIAGSLFYAVHRWIPGTWSQLSN